jgi:Flp pilus assembly protein CpaB
LKRSNRLILLIGVFFAIVAFIGIVFIVQGNRGSGGPSVATELPTVFAAKPITLGSEITADMLQVTTTKVTERDPTAYTTPTLLLGKIAGKDIPQGKQLTGDDFNRGGNLSSVTVPVGMRAISVTVDQGSGVGTLIHTGDYVDLLVGITGDKFPVITLTDSNNFQVVSGINATSAKVLLQGMQVIGTLLPPPSAAQAQAQQANANNNGGGEGGGASLNNQQEIVILAVSAQQAEVIKFAQIDGSISLVLRSPKDFRDDQGNPIAPAPAGTTGITLRVLVDEYRVLIPQLVETAVPAQARPR